MIPRSNTSSSVHPQFTLKDPKAQRWSFESWFQKGQHLETWNIVHCIPLRPTCLVTACYNLQHPLSTFKLHHKDPPKKTTATGCALLGSRSHRSCCSPRSWTKMSAHRRADVARWNCGADGGNHMEAEEADVSIDCDRWRIPKSQTLMYWKSYSETLNTFTVWPAM